MSTQLQLALDALTAYAHTDTKSYQAQRAPRGNPSSPRQPTDAALERRYEQLAAQAIIEDERSAKRITRDARARRVMADIERILGRS